MPTAYITNKEPISLTGVTSISPGFFCILSFPKDINFHFANRANSTKRTRWSDADNFLGPVVLLPQPFGRATASKYRNSPQPFDLVFPPSPSSPSLKLESLHRTTADDDDDWQEGKDRGDNEISEQSLSVTTSSLPTIRQQYSVETQATTSLVLCAKNILLRNF